MIAVDLDSSETEPETTAGRRGRPGRHEATLRSKWASALFRCCMHRIQTAEKVLLQGLERKTESFFLNVTLSFRKTPSSWALFAKRARAWLKTVSASRADIPQDVQQWRAALRDLLFHDASHRLPSAQRLACFDELTRGDGRVSGRPLHYGCKPECCPSAAETQRRFAEEAPAVLLKTPPVLFPRKSWHGQAEAMNPIIQLEAANGLLSQCFRSVEAAAKVKSAKAVERRGQPGGIVDSQGGQGGEGSGGTQGAGAHSPSADPRPGGSGEGSGGSQSGGPSADPQPGGSGEGRGGTPGAGAHLPSPDPRPGSSGEGSGGTRGAGARSPRADPRPGDEEVTPLRPRVVPSCLRFDAGLIRG